MLLAGVERRPTRALPSQRKQAFRRPDCGVRLSSVGTATPPDRYTQEEVLDWFQETDPRIRRLYLNNHIQSRYLYLPPRVNGTPPEETHQQLIDKHLNGALEIGTRAIEEAAAPLGLVPQDLDFLVCVSSTGLLCPGISAHIVRELGCRENIQRVDLLGMGCNAALNGMQVATALARSRPGKVGAMLCVEICSAAYVHNRRMSTAVVNSLFGDGAAVAIFRQDDNSDDREQGPAVVDLESSIFPDHIDAMKYELDGTKLSFYLDRDIPYVIGQNVQRPVGRLLARNGLRIRDIDHWIVHSGGKRVIDAIEYNLGLTDYDVRHTLEILKNYGNLSSGSVLFSYKELCNEGVIRAGDLCVVIAMGPGTSIETALLAW